jgi:hypothetical protein
VVVADESDELEESAELDESVFVDFAFLVLPPLDEELEV